MFQVALSLFSNINQSACSTRDWVLNRQSGFDRVLYKYHWKIPRHKKIIPILTCPIQCQINFIKWVEWSCNRPRDNFFIGYYWQSIYALYHQFTCCSLLTMSWAINQSVTEWSFSTGYIIQWWVSHNPASSTEMACIYCNWGVWKIQLIHFYSGIWNRTIKISSDYQ